MGIPKLYSVVSRRWPNVIAPATDHLGCDNLCIDLGSILHGCLERASDYECVSTLVQAFLLRLIELVNPQKTVFIALDGVPPLCKIKEQILRRERSSRTSNGLDPNVLSPGTPFMIDLGKELKRFASDNKDMKMIVSDSLEPGEGEQKIMRFIRSSCDPKTIVYGLDADLIVLSLTVASSSILLLREIWHTRNNSAEEKDFEIFYVDRFKKSLVAVYDTPEEDRVLQDIAVLLCLLGNDFLPRPYGIEVDATTIVDLLSLLRDFHSKKMYLISGDGVLRTDSFRCFCSMLFDFDFKRFRTWHQMKKSELTEEILTLELHGLSLREKKFQINEHLDTVMKERFENWAIQQYSRSMTKESILEISIQYLAGLRWVIDYYFHGRDDKYFLYGHCISPRLSHLSQGVEQFQGVFEQLPPSITISPLHHLCLVTPKSSQDILDVYGRKPIEMPPNYNAFLEQTTRFKS